MGGQVINGTTLMVKQVAKIARLLGIAAASPHCRSINPVRYPS